MIRSSVFSTLRCVSTRGCFATRPQFVCRLRSLSSSPSSSLPKPLGSTADAGKNTGDIKQSAKALDEHSSSDKTGGSSAGELSSDDNAKLASFLDSTRMVVSSLETSPEFLSLAKMQRNDLWRLCQVPGRAELAAKCLEFDLEILKSCFSLDQERMSLCEALHDSTVLVARAGGDVSCLAGVIALAKEELIRESSEPASQYFLCAISGIFVRRCVVGTDIVVAFDEVITLYKELLAKQSAGANKPNTELLEAYELLTNMLGTWHTHTREQAFLDDAVAIQRDVAAQRAYEDPDRSRSYTRLAFLLKELHTATQDPLFLMQAVEAARVAAQLWPANDASDPDSVVVLAILLRLQHKAVGDASALNEALAVLRSARVRLDADPGIVCDAAGIYSSLAQCIKDRYTRTGEKDLYDEYVAVRRKAIEIAEARR